MIAEQVKGSIIVEMAKNAIGAFCLSVAIANERYFRRSERRLWIGGSLALPINGASLPGLLLLACFCDCLDWCCVHGEHPSSVRCDHGNIVAGVDDHVVNKRDR